MGQITYLAHLRWRHVEAPRRLVAVLRHRLVAPQQAHVRRRRRQRALRTCSAGYTPFLHDRANSFIPRQVELQLKKVCLWVKTLHEDRELEPPEKFSKVLQNT